ncbi:MAG: M48 family metallopeptidase [Pseudolabrys sp.]
MRGLCGPQRQRAVAHARRNRRRTPPPEIAQLRDYYSQLHRLNTVAYRIVTANREYCDKWLVAQTGMVAATPQSLPHKYQKFSVEALGLRWVRPTVISVVEDGPAGKAGIIVEDELISFNGEPVPVTATLRWINAFMEDNGERPVEVILRRDGEDRTLTLNPVIGCAIPINLETNPEANAFTDYKKIVIQSGLLRLTRTEADLATLVGHELGHVTMGHYKKKNLNALVGALGGTAIDGGLLMGGIYSGGVFTNYLAQTGMMAFSPAFELEADYVGAYMRHVPAMISQVPRKFGGPPRWKIRKVSVYQRPPDLAGALSANEKSDRGDRRQEASRRAAGP